MTDQSSFTKPSTSVNAAEELAAQQLGTHWEIVLDIKRAITDSGAPVPEISDAVAVREQISQTMPHALYTAALGHAVQIQLMWEQAAAGSPTDTTNVAGLAGLSALLSDFGKFITTANAKAAAALVLAAGPEFAPAEAWEQATGLASA